MSDMNAVIGEEEEEEMVAKFGSRKRNGRGDTFVEFC